MDRPLKHLVSRIKDATAMHDHDDWEVWASLFPDIASLAEKTRRSAATNRGNLSPDRLRTQLLESRNSFQRFGFGVCRTAGSRHRCGRRALFLFAGVFLLLAQG